MQHYARECKITDVERFVSETRGEALPPYAPLAARNLEASRRNIQSVLDPPLEQFQHLFTRAMPLTTASGPSASGARIDAEIELANLPGLVAVVHGDQ